MDADLQQPEQQPPSSVAFPAPVQKKSCRWLWIIVGIVAFLLVVGVSAIVYFVYAVPAAQNAVAQTYCNALKQDDYQTAYNQLSSRRQSQETEQQFVANSGSFSGSISFGSGTSSGTSLGSVTDCTYDKSGLIELKYSNGTFLIAPVTWVFEGGWKIQ